MSLFKEKDDFIKNAFQKIFNASDSDESDRELDANQRIKRSRLEEEEEPVNDGHGSSGDNIKPRTEKKEYECITLSDGSNDSVNYITISDEEDQTDLLHKNVQPSESTPPTSPPPTLTTPLSTTPPPPPSTTPPPSNVSTSVEDSDNEINVKLQDGNLRHTKKFKILKNQPIKQLKRLYANEFQIDNLSSIKLWFDGEAVDEYSTPDELDIEDDCVVDVVIQNS